MGNFRVIQTLLHSLANRKGLVLLVLFLIGAAWTGWFIVGLLIDDPLDASKLSAHKEQLKTAVFERAMERLTKKQNEVKALILTTRNPFESP